MRKIALFTSPLPTQGGWYGRPLRVERIPESEDKRAVGVYEARFATPAGQPVQFTATVHAAMDLHPVGTAITLSFWTGEEEDMILTGKGEAIQIFATVIDLTLTVYDQVRKIVPNGVIYVTFESSSRERSRVKLYAKLAQQLANVRDGTVIQFGPEFIVRFDPPPETSWGG